MWNRGLRNGLLTWSTRLIPRLTFTSMIGAWEWRKSGKRVKFLSCPIVPQPHGPFCSHTALAQLCSLRLFRLPSIWWERCYSAGSTLQLGQVIPCIPALSADNSGRASWSSINFANFVFAFLCQSFLSRETHSYPHINIFSLFVDGYCCSACVQYECSVSLRFLLRVIGFRKYSVKYFQYILMVIY